jgi:lysophospholipid acyltransferase (LPLAT)-like uncharacterized protein
MKITSPLVHKLAALLGTTAIRTWMSTLDYQVLYYDPAVDPVQPGYAGQKIYIFWHEYILAPIHMRGHCNLAMLISQHRDAEILSYAARHLGFEFVRGSTTRGGASALRDLMDKSHKMNLAITPDGPRGPRRKLAPGAVYLSSKLGLPLVAMGLGVDRPWRLNSWDRFAIPRPWSRVRGVISPAVMIPPDLDRDGLEHYRLEVERLLNRLTEEAESWSAAGTRRPTQQPARREQYRAHLRRIDPPHDRRIAALGNRPSAGPNASQAKT